MESKQAKSSRQKLVTIFDYFILGHHIAAAGE
jgi:hypothetical protein